MRINDQLTWEFTAFSPWTHPDTQGQGSTFCCLTSSYCCRMSSNLMLLPCMKSVILGMFLGTPPSYGFFSQRGFEEFWDSFKAGKSVRSKLEGLGCNSYPGPTGLHHPNPTISYHFLVAQPCGNRPHPAPIQGGGTNVSHDPAPPRQQGLESERLTFP